MADQLTPISKRHLRDLIGRLDQNDMHAVENFVRLQLDLRSF